MGEARLTDRLEGMAAQLADILDRYREHHRAPAERPPPQGEMTQEVTQGLIAFLSVDLSKPIPPRWVSALDEQQRDPVRYSLKASARDVGWRAFAIGGLDFMHKVADRMEELRPDTTWHGAILDKWWDNIGCDERGFWCC
jgi:hypothetical protein